MSKFAHRTQRLEDALNLEEMISRWLRELQRFESPGDYLLKISGKLENLSPAHQFLDQARHQLQGAPSARPDKKRDEEIRQSLRRLSFLRHLLWVANSDVEQLVIDCSQRLELANTILEMLDFSCGHNQTSIIQPHHAALGRPGSVKNAEQFTERAHRVVSDILCAARSGNCGRVNRTPVFLW